MFFNKIIIKCLPVLFEQQKSRLNVVRPAFQQFSHSPIEETDPFTALQTF